MIYLDVSVQVRIIYQKLKFFNKAIWERINMTKRNGNDEEFLKDLSNSLANQVKEELDNEMVDKVSRMVKKKKKKSKKIALKIIISVLCVIVASGAFLTFTPIGRKLLVRLATNYIYDRMDENKPEPAPSETVANEDGEKEKEPEEKLKAGEITDNIDLSQMSDTFKNAMHEDGVYNIMLLGVEAIGYGNSKGGHTDSIMIATINTKQKTLGLASIMRDTYVAIPGYNNNRINVAYALGGVNLLYETVAENYGVRVDGSVLVDFNSFQQVVDDLGGVDIEITQAEANYLNTTNYISKKANRNLKPGINHMNGNQALGYARIRKESTLDGSHDDMGRTSRHRRVITAIFNKMKKSNPATLVTMMNTIIPKVQTDVKRSNASSYLAELVELSIDGVGLDTMRFPEDGNYQPQKINKMSVVGVINWDDSRKNLKNFLFASHEKPEKTEKKGK